MKRNVLPALAVLSLLSAHRAGAQALDGAAPYNLFVYNNDTAGGTDIFGQVAVGGNGNYSAGYTLGSKLPQNSAVNFVFGGTYTNNGTQTNGSIVANGDVVVSSPSISGSLKSNGNVTITGGGSANGVQYGVGKIYTGPAYFNPTQGTTAIPVDFAGIESKLNARSSYWATLSGTTYMGSNNISLTGGHGLNVFYLTTTQLGSATSFSYNGFADSTFLIDVTGTGSVSVPNTGTTLSGGLTLSQILYNFVNATSITLPGSFNGSLLAPKATLTATSGAFNGQLIANTVNSGALELHSFDPNNLSVNQLFTGSIPLPADTPNVPEPGTYALLASLGLSGLGFFVRRRTRK